MSDLPVENTVESTVENISDGSTAASEGSATRTELTPAEPVRAEAEEKAIASTARVSEERRRPGSPEMTVPTLLQLMGLPSNKELQLIEAKLDTLNSKLSTVATRLERIASQVGKVMDENYLDRIDHQLADLRLILKRALPKAIAGDMDLPQDAPREDGKSGRFSLRSQPAAKELEKVEPSVLPTTTKEKE